VGWHRRLSWVIKTTLRTGIDSFGGIAMQLYENKIFTFSQARRLLNYSVWEFKKMLGENHIVRQYDQDDLAEDIEAIQSGLWDG